MFYWTVTAQQRRWPMSLVSQWEVTVLDLRHTCSKGTQQRRREWPTGAATTRHVCEWLHGLTSVQVHKWYDDFFYLFFIFCCCWFFSSSSYPASLFISAWKSAQWNWQSKFNINVLVSRIIFTSRMVYAAPFIAHIFYSFLMLLASLGMLFLFLFSSFTCINFTCLFVYFIHLFV